MLADEIDQPIGLRELVVPEGNHRAFRSRIDLLDIGAAAIGFDGCDLEQVTDFIRQRAEAVTQLRGEIFDFVIGVEVGQPAIQRQPNCEIRDVIFRNQTGIPMVICGDQRSSAGSVTPVLRF